MFFARGNNELGTRWRQWPQLTYGQCICISNGKVTKWMLIFHKNGHSEALQLQKLKENSNKRGKIVNSLSLRHVIFKHKISKARSFKAPNYFCYILLTFPQLAHLKAFFHHMLSRSSSVAESSAKRLSAGLTVSVPCFMSNLLLSDILNGTKQAWNKKIPCWMPSSQSLYWRLPQATDS